MSRAAALFLALALFAACLFLYTRHNAFPFYCHPDEPQKVLQVMTGSRNFHHPMLLLTVTEAAVKMLHVPMDDQRVVQAGRWVSAAFTALAVVALALLAGLWRGPLAASATGAALMLHHQLFELSHFFKEDSALLFGLALTFLAAVAATPSSQVVLRGVPAAGCSGLFLGLACGLATSGKYLGAVSLAIALPLLWRGADRQRQLLVFAAAFAATFALFNLPMLTQPAASRQGFGREMDLVVKGQSGATRSVPHAQYWNVFIDNTTPAMWLLLAAFLAARWRERRQLPLVQWLIIGFPFVFALALSFSPKSNDRYFLPATAVITLLAALGTVDVARWLRKPWAPALAAALLVMGQVPSLVRYARAFQHDDNAELFEWLRAAREIPADAVIVKDGRIILPDPKKKQRAAFLPSIPQQVLAARFAADRGTLAEQRAAGVTHVAISESDYGKFFLPGIRAQAGGEGEFARRRAFYAEVLHGSPPLPVLFARERGTVLYLHPGIRVYRIGGGE